MNLENASEEQLAILEQRFAENRLLHPNVNWSEVKASLAPEDLSNLAGLEARGGMPDLVEEHFLGYYFGEVSPECPHGPENKHRNIVYNAAIQGNMRRDFPNELLTVNGNAVDILGEFAAMPMRHDIYKKIQRTIPMDRSGCASFLLTPMPVLAKGSLIAGMRDYQDHVIVREYDSINLSYSNLGVRGMLWVYKKRLNAASGAS